MLAIVASSAILYFTILLLLETNFVRKIWEKFLIAVYNLGSKSMQALVDDNEDDVKTEERRILQVFQIENRLRHRYEYNLNQGKRKTFALSLISFRISLIRTFDSVR